MEYMKELYWENLGSYCHVFGVKGSWAPHSDNLLSIDKIDVKKGFEPGNLLIMLKCANFGRNECCWQEFYFGEILVHLKLLELPTTYIGTVVEYRSCPTSFVGVCTHPGCTKKLIERDFCIEHGGIQARCTHPGCTKRQKISGFCIEHSGIQARCTHPRCTKG
jgi:hypothetical protein